MQHSTVWAIAPLLCALTAPPVIAAEAAGGEQQCIDMKDVDHTSVIDGRTILVTMKRDAYKRIDLVRRCLGLAVEETFAFNMQTYELCKSTPLRVVNGGICAIDKIVNIDSAEAKALRARR